FYVNKWADLDDAARGLEQTARFFTKATDVPPKLKDILPVAAGDLGKEAGKLREAAKAQDPKLANESLQRINLKIRELRLDNSRPSRMRETGSASRRAPSACYVDTDG